MDGDNAMHCENCKRDTRTSKKMEVYEANKILVLCLRRFHEDQKNERSVIVPTVIEPCDFVTDRKSPQYDGKVYQLYGAIIHSGSLRGGHYVAICYDYNQKKWFEYSDSWVREISLKDSRLE
jgi:ubiquitin C-terminal hydrolase